jgi:hypothetical protein
MYRQHYMCVYVVLLVVVLICNTVSSVAHEQNLVPAAIATVTVSEPGPGPESQKQNFNGESASISDVSSFPTPVEDTSITVERTPAPDTSQDLAEILATTSPQEQMKKLEAYVSQHQLMNEQMAQLMDVKASNLATQRKHIDENEQKVIRLQSILNMFANSAPTTAIGEHAAAAERRVEGAFQQVSEQVTDEFRPGKYLLKGVTINGQTLHQSVSPTFVMELEKGGSLSGSAEYPANNFHGDELAEMSGTYTKTHLSYVEVFQDRSFSFEGDLRTSVAAVTGEYRFGAHEKGSFTFHVRRIKEMPKTSPSNVTVAGPGPGADGKVDVSLEHLYHALANDKHTIRLAKHVFNIKVAQHTLGLRSVLSAGFYRASLRSTSNVTHMSKLHPMVVLHLRDGGDLDGMIIYPSNELHPQTVVSLHGSWNKRWIQVQFRFMGNGFEFSGTVNTVGTVKGRYKFAPSLVLAGMHAKHGTWEMQLKTVEVSMMVMQNKRKATTVTVQVPGPVKLVKRLVPIHTHPHQAEATWARLSADRVSNDKEKLSAEELWALGEDPDDQDNEDEEGLGPRSKAERAIKRVLQRREFDDTRVMDRKIARIEADFGKVKAEHAKLNQIEEYDEQQQQQQPDLDDMVNTMKMQNV